MTTPQIVLCVVAALFIGLLFGSAVAISVGGRGAIVGLADAWARARDRRRATAEALAAVNVERGYPDNPPERAAWLEAERAELELADQLHEAVRARLDP